MPMSVPAAHAALLAIVPGTTEAVLEENREGRLHPVQRRRMLLEGRVAGGIFVGIGVADLGALAAAGGLDGSPGLLALTVALVGVPVAVGAAIHRWYLRRIERPVTVQRGRLVGRRIDERTVHVSFDGGGRVFAADPDLVGLPVEVALWEGKIVAVGLDHAVARRELRRK
ncbi:hypothetical protein [Kineosporia sp. R_H_3]|uniref:hypothetical protein n=1 Tax=Kineosporia sp. R_H_3 TaxID=1961848 RepID=UPI000B4BCB88|nr:hypothetical protein [Kineosporia sp. R_H_3]